MSNESDVRLVAVVVCDVDGSTELRSRLGEEEADAASDQLQRGLRAVLIRFGATSVHSTGDGLWALVPSASAALMSSVALQDACNKIGRRINVDATMRVGIAVGDVQTDEHDVRGLPMVEASRLVAAALPGEILATDLVCTLANGRGTGTAGGYALGPSQLITVRGLAEQVSVRTVRAGWPNFDAKPLPPNWGVGRDPWPTCGRVADRELLQEAAERARAGESSLTIVEGRAGIGKTHLVTEFARVAHEGRFVVLGGRCTEGGSDPYQPLAEALERVLATCPTWFGQVQSAALSPDLIAITPALGGILSLEQGARWLLDAHTGEARVHRAVIDLFMAATEVEPLVLIVDDLHWASSSTLRILDAIIAACRTQNDVLYANVTADAQVRNGIAIVLTLRSEPADVSADITSFILNQRRVGQTVSISLEPLAESAVEEMFHNALEFHAVSPALAGSLDAFQLHRMTGGHPFFLTELFRVDNFNSDGQPAYLTGVIPATIGAFVQQRLHRLGPDAQALAECLAIDPAGVETWALAALTALPEPLVERASRVLIDGGVVVEVGSLPSRLAFLHDLSRQTVLASMHSFRRERLHRLLAVNLSARTTIAVADVYRLAEHFCSAAVSGREDDLLLACRACRAAADDAASRAAHGDAATWYQEALRFADSLGSALLVEDRVRLQIGEGVALLAVGDALGRTALANAAALASQQQRPELVGEVLLASSRGFFSQVAFPDMDRIAALRVTLSELPQGSFAALRARLLAELGAELTWHPEGEGRFALSDEALRLARGADDVTTFAHVLVRRNLTVAAADTLADCLETCDELLCCVDQANDRRLQFDALFHRTGPAIAMGDVPTLRTCLSRAGELADLMMQPQLQWLVAFSGAALALFTGDVAAAEQLAQRARDVGFAAKVGLEAVAFHQEQMCEIRRLRGVLDLEVNSFRRRLARPLIDPVCATLRYAFDAGAQDEVAVIFDGLELVGFPLPRNLAERPAIDNLALLAARLRRPEATRLFADRLAPFASTIGHSAVAHPCGHHYLGVLAAAQDDRDAAFDHFEAAVDLEATADLPLLAAESLIEWRWAALSAGKFGVADELQRRALSLLCGRGAAGLDRLARMPST